jgi:nitrile hydratase accessory protein
VNADPGPRADAVAATLDGAAALPRRNGELVFSAPWESRAFGMAVALHQRGVYEWDDFRDRLVAEIGAAPDEDGADYYERWLASLERLLLDRGLISADDVAARARRIAEHDHHH